jgi:hypothetical protein
MIDPTRFRDDPATRHADERFMTMRDPFEAERPDSLWRTPAEDLRDPYDIDHDRLESALHSLDFEDGGDWPDWQDDGGGWRPAMQHRARSGADGALEFARRNPVGTALALAGAALLLAPRVERDDVRAGYARARAGGARMPGGSGAQRAELRRRLARMRRQIEDGTEGMSDEARRRLVAARHRTLDARERALDHADRLRARAERQARAGMETAREHPVMTGTLALALGAAVAASLPGPRRRIAESGVGTMAERLMHEAEDIYARERALIENAARGAWDEARRTASETAREMQRRVPDGERLAEQAERRAEQGVSRIAAGASRGARRRHGG